MEAITQSMMGMFLRCPHQFERRYIRGEIIPPGIAARRGSATHKAAQLNHEQKLHSQADLPVGDLQDSARDHYVTLIREEGVFIPKEQLPDKDKLLAAGLDATVRLTALYRESLAPAIQPLLVEERMTCEAGLGLPLQGTIDVFTTDHWLPDLKTADKSKGPKDADYSLQLTFYLCRPGGPPDRELASEGEPGSPGEQQGTEATEPAHHPGTGGLDQPLAPSPVNAFPDRNRALSPLRPQRLDLQP